MQFSTDFIHSRFSINIKSEKESGRSTSIILILCFLDIQRNLDHGLTSNLAILYRKNQGLFSCQKFLKIMTVSRSAKNQIGVGWCASRLMFCITNWRYLFSNLLDSRDGYTLHDSSPLDACQTTCQFGICSALHNNWAYHPIWRQKFKFIYSLHINFIV